MAEGKKEYIEISIPLEAPSTADQKAVDLLTSIFRQMMLLCAGKIIR